MASIDWKSKQEVCDYCKRMAIRGNISLLVIKYSGRINYNICHLSRYDIWQRNDVEVIYEYHIKARHE